MNKTPVTLGDAIVDARDRFEEAGLVFGHSITDAQEDAVFLVCETLHLPLDVDLDALWKKELTSAEKSAIEQNVKTRLETRKPSAYIVNRAYLQGLSFYVDERVIVPRSFIAEILCAEDGFSRISDYDAEMRVADICTGSGCLAILAAHIFPNAIVDAVELSPDAFAVAQRNVKERKLEKRVNLYKGDLLNPLKGKKYDLIITNPPYVDKEGMTDLPPEYAHEPAMALDGTIEGGADGMDLVRKILHAAPDYLTPNGGLICEIGRGKPAVEAAFPGLPFLWLDTDLSEGEVFWITRAQLISGLGKS